MKKAERFWRWFGCNCDRLFKQEEFDLEESLDEVLEHLHEYHEHLFFEIGSSDGQTMDFIVTACGYKEYFDVVYELVNAAPPMEGWNFIPLKPAMERYFKTDYYGIHLDTEKIGFVPLDNSEDPHAIGIRVFIDYTDDNHGICYEAVLMIINTILGEKATAELIDYVELAKTDGGEEAAPIAELPEYICWRITEGS